MNYILNYICYRSAKKVRAFRMKLNETLEGLEARVYRRYFEYLVERKK